MRPTVSSAAAASSHASQEGKGKHRELGEKARVETVLAEDVWLDNLDAERREDLVGAGDLVRESEQRGFARAGAQPNQDDPRAERYKEEHCREEDGPGGAQEPAHLRWRPAPAQSAYRRVIHEQLARPHHPPLARL